MGKGLLVLRKSSIMIKEVMSMACKKLLEEIEDLVSKIVEASNLERRVQERLSKDIKPIDPKKGVIVVSLGKGAVSMAKGALNILGERVIGGVVAVPYSTNTKEELGPLEVVRGSHPIPDERSVRAAEKVIEWAKEAKNSGGLLALISGGGSATVEMPLEPLTIDDIKELNKLLLLSGASIREINTVRKHVSRIKGGRLAYIAHPAKILGLYASDVPGDRIEDIASGPTAPDPTTFLDAINVLKSYNIFNRVPKNVVEVLNRGVKGEIEETPKPGNSIFSNVRNEVVARNLDVLNYIERELKERGYRVLKLTSRVEGESSEVGKVLASIALESLDTGIPYPPPFALVVGGETNVTVKGKGVGGRNQELVLAWALRARYWAGDLDNVALIAVDTDGIDGFTDAAGGFMFPSDIGRARSLGLDPEEYLRNNDSYTFLKKINRLIVTGPTGSNLNSVIVMLVDRC